MWFDSWGELFRVLVVGAASYGTLVLVLRLSGKRTLAKLNAFDFVVTVALGSTLAAILLNRAVSWAEGAIALILGQPAVRGRRRCIQDSTDALRTHSAAHTSGSRRRATG